MKEMSGKSTGLWRTYAKPLIANNNNKKDWLPQHVSLSNAQENIQIQIMPKYSFDVFSLVEESD